METNDITPAPWHCKQQNNITPENGSGFIRSLAEILCKNQ